MSVCGFFGSSLHDLIEVEHFDSLFKVTEQAGDGTCFYASFAAGLQTANGLKPTSYETRRLATKLRKLAGSTLCPNGLIHPNRFYPKKYVPLPQVIVGNIEKKGEKRWKKAKIFL